MITGFFIHYPEVAISIIAAGVLSIGITIGYIVGRTAQKAHAYLHAVEAVKSDHKALAERLAAYSVTIRDLKERNYSYRVKIEEISNRLARIVEVIQ